MKQLLTKDGIVSIVEIPAPIVGDSTVLVQTSASLISTGTETMVMHGQSGSLLSSLAKNPSLLLLGLQKIRERGIRKTYNLVTHKDELGTPLGYSASGTVIAVGKDIPDIRVGDRVACAGAGIANHAEILAVPRNLLVKIPEKLSFEEAAFVTLGAIALQGVRQADLRLGETVLVTGLGLLGQLTVQLLKASGCTVIGIDVDAERIATALSLGADHALLATTSNLEQSVATITNGYGVDATIITAATPSNDPLNQAMQFTRKKGRVVIVGAIGMNLQRSPFYEKEIALTIACSYGPGRYDPDYEFGGIDYPFGYVRWTENRNMEAFLQLAANERIQIAPLISKRYDLSAAMEAYTALQQPGKKPLAVVLHYDGEKRTENDTLLRMPANTDAIQGRIGVGLIGAGNFATTMHLPNLEKLRNIFSIYAIVDQDGVIAKKVAQQYSASIATTDYHQLLRDKNVDLIIITTRHHLHARLAQEALHAGKSVLVEKPMAMNRVELEDIVKTIQETGQHYLVGFNRRFSQASQLIREKVRQRHNPLMAYYRMNAGYIPPQHWTQGPDGGGRIIGEACHIFDLFNFWTGSKPMSIEAQSIRPRTKNYLPSDNACTTMRFEDGSVCTLLYTALGNAGLPKEYAEVYCDGNIFVLDDYKAVHTSIAGKNSTQECAGKGHIEELEIFANTLKEERDAPPISLDEMVNATETSFTVNSLLHDDQ